MRTKSHFDTIVIGGGSAGATVAGRLAAETDQSVLLVEAGPDYGARDGGTWPADLCDARKLALSHDWGYVHEGATGAPGHLLERARVMGGCSAHNGCIAIWGHADDYDGWAAQGCTGWDTRAMLPRLHAAHTRMRARHYSPAETTPFHAACLDAIAAQGVPRVADLNALDEAAGVDLAPVNVVDGVRWNAAFAYLDPARGRPNLHVLDRAMTDAVLFDGSRATGVRVLQEGALRELHADRVVLCAGAYGTPAILLRSGVGDVRALRALGIKPRFNLPGVGANLHDHPCIYLAYRGTPQGIAALEAFEAQGNILVAEQSLAKMCSPHCQRAFDLHIFPVGGRAPGAGDAWEFMLPVAVMTPHSRGNVRLRDANPASVPVIDAGYVSDKDGNDARVLSSGVQLAREVAHNPQLAAFLGDELPDSAAIRTLADVRAACRHYYHPVGTCRMGSPDDAGTVVDPTCRLLGTDNVFVADASIMPVIPRANTNIPAIAVAERFVDLLLEFGK